MCLLFYDTDCKDDVETWVVVVVVVVFALCCFGSGLYLFVYWGAEAEEQRSGKELVSELSSEVDSLPRFDDQGNPIRTSSTTTVGSECTDSISPYEERQNCGPSSGTIEAKEVKRARSEKRMLGLLSIGGDLSPPPPAAVEHQPAIDSTLPSPGTSARGSLRLSVRNSEAENETGSWQLWFGVRRCCY